MTPRGDRIGKAAPLLLPLSTDTPPASFDYIVAEQVDAHPNTIVARDIMGRVERAQVDEAERKRAFHCGRIGVCAFPVLRLV